MRSPSVMTQGWVVVKPQLALSPPAVCGKSSSGEGTESWTHERAEVSPPSWVLVALNTWHLVLNANSVKQHLGGGRTQ